MQTIEAHIGSPPEKEKLTVQLFAAGSGPQWAEIDFEKGGCVLELFVSGDVKPLRFPLEEVMHVFQLAKQRLEKAYPPAGVTKESMAPVSLNLVVLRVPDLARAADFYSALGLTFEKHAHEKGPEHFAAELGSTVFELYPQGSEEGATKNARVGFQVVDAVIVLSRLEGKGAKVVSPLKDSPWGRRAVVDDPFGHRVEITEAKKNPVQPPATSPSGGGSPD